MNRVFLSLPWLTRGSSAIATGGARSCAARIVRMPSLSRPQNQGCMYAHRALEVPPAAAPSTVLATSTTRFRSRSVVTISASARVRAAPRRGGPASAGMCRCVATAASA